MTNKTMRLILASSSEGKKKLLSLLKISFTVIPSTVDEEKIFGQTPLETLKLRARLKAEDVVSSPKLLKSLKKPILRLCSGQATYNLPPTTYLILSADSGGIVDGKLFGKPKDYDEAVRILRMLSGKTHQYVTAIYAILINSKRKAQSAKPQLKAKSYEYFNFNRGWRELGEPQNRGPLAGDFGAGERQDPQIKIVKTWQDHEVSLVTFKKLSKEDIRRYLSLIKYTKFAGGFSLFACPPCPHRPTLEDFLSNIPYTLLLRKICNCKIDKRSRRASPQDFITKTEGSLSNVVGLPLEKVTPILKENGLLE